MPKVSIIIPVYNHQAYVGQAIGSALGQTFNDLEVIVVDDGSTDATPIVLQSYADRIFCIRKENGGVASALNVGITHARGEYLAWLSSDDMFLPDKVRRQVEIMDMRPEVGLVYTDYYVVDENGTVVDQIASPWVERHRFVREMLRQGCFINGSTTLFRRSCLDIVGEFDESISLTADADMWYRMYQVCEFAHIPEPLIKERRHPNLQRHRVDAMADARRRMFRQLLQRYSLAEIFPELVAECPNDRSLEARARCELGDDFARRRVFDLAREQYLKALYMDSRAGNPAIRSLLRTILVDENRQRVGTLLRRLGIKKQIRFRD